jgi:hypothetical protein
MNWVLELIIQVLSFYRKCSPGIAASDYYHIQDDYVFEVGLTPNRSDATSQLGVARDLLAYLKVNEGYTDEIKRT